MRRRRLGAVAPVDDRQQLDLAVGLGERHDVERVDLLALGRPDPLEHERLLPLVLVVAEEGLDRGPHRIPLARGIASARLALAEEQRVARPKVFLRGRERAPVNRTLAE